MKRLFYKASFKSAGAFCQGLLAGVLALCLLIVAYWMEGSLNVSELGKDFEQTRVFLELTESIVRRKVDYDQNLELFEQNGQYDEMREIDIRQYMNGMVDTANLNVNISYYIKDLLYFAQNGAADMLTRIQDLSLSGYSDQEIGEILSEESGELETISPISGSSLADYAKMSANPAATLLEYDQHLCEVSMDIYRRYTSYENAKEESDGETNSEAPSNVSYYIENMNTKQRYTNLHVNSFPAAQESIMQETDLEFLFEGERSFNIMIANSEYVMNEEAGQWFLDKRFVGTGEKVILAIDKEYKTGDSLQKAYIAFTRREPILLACSIIAALSILTIIVLLIYSVIVTGRSEKGSELQNILFDRVPTEIAAGLCMIAAIVWYFICLWIKHQMAWIPERIILTGAVCVEYWILLASFLSLVRRIKGKNLWNNSVCYLVILGSRQVYNAKKSSGILMIAYLVFFALNFIFLRFFGISGIFMAVVTDMAALLFLMRDEVGKQVVREGLYQISQGHLDYKIDTTALIGDSLEMGQAVNEMGDGLAQAVDSIIKNERLKAELITNVSHDIKTPLTSIINYVDLLKREKLDNPKALEYIEILEQKSHRLKQLTEDLIEASKISSGNVEIHKVKLEVRSMLHQAYGEFAERLEECGLETVMELEKEPLYIMADGRQLWRILENLLGNVVKYALEGTRFYLVVKKEGSYACIECKNVSRQKLEVSAEELQERFVRGDRSRKTEGSGLGLSIAKNLTQLMDGSFDIDLDGDYFRAILLFPLVEEGKESE